MCSRKLNFKSHSKRIFDFIIKADDGTLKIQKNLRNNQTLQLFETRVSRDWAKFKHCSNPQNSTKPFPIVNSI